MSFDRLTSAASRLFFAGAFVLLGLGAIERIANAAGYTILRGALTGGRLAEIAVALLIFVIAMQLREIKMELRKSR